MQVGAIRRAWAGWVAWWCYGCQPHIERRVKEVEMKLSELAGAMVGLEAQLGKAKAEILAKIEALEQALQDVEVPAEAVAALEAAKAAAQGLDDVVPDAPAEG